MMIGFGKILLKRNATALKLETGFLFFSDLSC